MYFIYPAEYFRGQKLSRALSFAWKKKREIIDKNFRVWTNLSQISRKKLSRILCKAHIHVKKWSNCWSLAKKTFAFERYSYSKHLESS